MPQVTVIADDLTGAADCGIAFRLAGLPTFVSIGEVTAAAGAQVISIDLDTRHRKAADAAARSFTVTSDAWRAGARVLYRKIDSTLRGNVGAEVAATARAVEESATPPPLVVAAPAFPATGRVTIGGGVVVAGVPLAETDTWRNSGMSGPAELPAMMEAAGLRAAVATRETVRRGPGALADEMARAASRSVRALVCDAESEDDLRTIAQAGASLDRPVIWCGSAGLARHLPAALGLAPGGPGAQLPALHPGSVLVLVGSRSGVAREQARLLAAEPGVVTIELAAEALLEADGEASRSAAARLRALVREGRDVLLMTGIERVVDLSRGTDIASALAQLVAGESASARGIVATGGDVARALMDAVGARGLHLVGEVEPGVPLGLTDTGPAIPMITKAGAFGAPATLQRCRAALRRPT